jgi:hypothetical protein
MQYENLVRDFALRTRANLETLKTLQRARSDLEFYEVTQLINSMLGLLVFPQQRYIDHIPEIALAELARDGWPIPKVEGSYPQVRNLRELVRYLRNAIAHCNLEFLSDDGQQISGLRVWNTDPRSGKTTWKARLTIDDIEKITTNFIQLLIKAKKEKSGNKP